MIAADDDASGAADDDAGAAAATAAEAEAVPEWLGALTRRAREVTGADMSAFLPPTDGSGRQSAVLIALAMTSDGPSVLLIERAARLRQHAGQVAFPGGALEPDDASPAAAAVREAQEETGLDPAAVRVLAPLPATFIPVTGFVVTPVLAWWWRPCEVRVADPAEVAAVVLVPLAELADPANRFRVTHPSGWVGPGFQAGGLFVWGFTAGLLDRVLTFGGWAHPWDEDVLRPLPPGLAGV